MKFPFLLLFAVILVGLAGCDDQPASSKTATSSATQARLRGHVLDDDGPVLNARIEVKDAKGDVIAHSDVQGETGYSLTLPLDTRYPIILSATPVDSSSPTLKAGILDSSTSEQDISPVSTIVVDTALSLGGLNETNVAKAAGAAIALRKKSGGGGGSGATSQSFKGDPTKQYGGWH